MKKIIFIFLLAAANATIAADRWTQLGRSKNGTIHVDTPTIQRNGDVARVWVMYSLITPERSPRNRPYTSTIAQMEYNCREHIYRKTQELYYEDPMAKGEVVESNRIVDEWERPIPGGLMESIGPFACEASSKPWWAFWK